MQFFKKESHNSYVILDEENLKTVYIRKSDFSYSLVVNLLQLEEFQVINEALNDSLIKLENGEEDVVISLLTEIKASTSQL